MCNKHPSKVHWLGTVCFGWGVVGREKENQHSKESTERQDLPSPSKDNRYTTNLYFLKRYFFSRSAYEFTVFLCFCDSGFRSKMEHLLHPVDIYYYLPLNAIITLQNVLKLGLWHFPFLQNGCFYVSVNGWEEEERKTGWFIKRLELFFSFARTLYLNANITEQVALMVPANWVQ